MVNTRGRCSGICLSDNGKFFYTVMQKRKMLAKFKVVQKETNSKLAPLAKMETGQLLDCSTIFKAKIKSGLLAVSSKDGHISFHSTSLDEKNKNVNKLHFFHHDSGGIFHSDVSSEGCILAVNLIHVLPSKQSKLKIMTLANKSIDIFCAWCRGFKPNCSS